MCYQNEYNDFVKVTVVYYMYVALYTVRLSQGTYMYSLLLLDSHVSCTCSAKRGHFVDANLCVICGAIRRAVTSHCGQSGQ